MAFLPAVLALAALAAAQSTEIVSVSGQGAPGNDHSAGAAISAGGRYVAFYSEATNLVPGDDNLVHDIFVHNFVNGSTWCASITTIGAVGNGGSFQPSITPDGRFVSFDGFATDLVAGDTNNQSDVFVFDNGTGLVERVSVSSLGVQGDRHSQWSSISADGRYVAFDSTARNLVPGDTNTTSDVFMHDRQTGATVRVSVSSTSAQANGPSQRPAISPDGRWVVFDSLASNLVPGDGNGRLDVFLHEVATGLTERVSVGTGGTQSDGDSFLAALSDDASVIAFASAATNLAPGDLNGLHDVFVRDRAAGTTERVSTDAAGGEANGPSTDPSLSADGRTVAFFSFADDLVAMDMNLESDVFVKERDTGAVELISVNTLGEQGHGASELPSVSADGRFVAFNSHSDNLVPGDVNHDHDVFLRERWDNDPVLQQTMLQRGLPATFQVGNVPAGEQVALLYSTAGAGGGPCHPQGGFCLGLLDPVIILAQERANSLGNAVFQITVPADAPLVTLHTQGLVLLGEAMKNSRPSNVISAQVFP